MQSHGQGVRRPPFTGDPLATWQQQMDARTMAPCHHVVDLDAVELRTGIGEQRTHELMCARPLELDTVELGGDGQCLAGSDRNDQWRRAELERDGYQEHDG